MLGVEHMDCHRFPNTCSFIKGRRKGMKKELKKLDKH